MSNVVVLKEYLRDKKTYAAQDREPPLIRDRDVWGRDFSVQENVIFAVLKIREILLFYLDTEEEWAPLLLWFLDECERASGGEDNNLADAAKDVKNYVAFEMDPWNAKEMRAALMLLDLIEKTLGRGK
jgi:hypothetical protein